MREVRRAVLIAIVFSVACGAPRLPADVDALADQYVKLVLAVGTHDSTYVDSFYGPREWRQEAARVAMPIPQIRDSAAALLDHLHQQESIIRTQSDVWRLRFLAAQTSSLIQRTDLLAGVRMSFDAESRGLFGITAPALGESSLLPVVAALDRQLPGTGPVSARLEAYSRKLAVPDDRVRNTVLAALAACRERTVEHLALPAGERVDVTFVHDRPWSAYATYQGGYRTRIEINLDLPRRPDQILDLMCHEGYPGHHTQYSLLEERMVRARGRREFQVQPLLSPASASSEGAAIAGVALAFPESARLDFERDVLFPIAGINASEARRMEAVRVLSDRLTPAGTEVARRYLDGHMSRTEAVVWLERYAAMPRPLELLGFIDQFRTYVVGYTASTQEIRLAIDEASNEDTRWRVLEQAILANVPQRD